MHSGKIDRSFFFLIVFSHGLLHIFDGSLAPLLPLIRAEFGLSYTAVGILTLSLSLCWAFSSILAGVVADKTDRIKLILSTFLLIGIFSCIMVLASIFLSTLLFLIFLFFSTGLFHPPTYSYLAKKYSEGKGKIFGIFESGGSVGYIIAPLVAGVVGSYLGWRYVYTLWALPAFVMAFLFYRFSSKNKLRNKREDKDKENDKEESSKRKALSHFYPRLKKIYLAQGLFGLVAGGSISFLPLFLTNVHKFPVGTAGGILSLFLVGGLAGKIIGGRYSDIWGPRKVITIGFFITSFFLFLVPLISGFSLIFVLLFAGVTFFMIFPALFVLTGEIKTTDLGLAYGIQILSASGSEALSKFLSGLVSDMLGIEQLFFMLSAVAFFAGIFLYFFLKQTN